ncbi:alcohol dehydrogenase [Faecalimonas canis]
MLAYVYEEQGKFCMEDREKPRLINATDAIVRVTLSSICSSDIHIKHGAVPRAVKGITIGHEMVGVVEEVGSEVTKVKKGDRVTVNVETFCGKCYFCEKGFVNNCTDEHGGWALGCRIDGGQAEYVRVPFAEQGLNKIPDSVTDEEALFVGDVLATGYWATRISEIEEEDTVVIIGGGPTGICTLLCVMLKQPKRIILCETDDERTEFIKKHYPEVMVVNPKEVDVEEFVKRNSDHGGADRVLEVAGSSSTFELAWKIARPNTVVTVVALYEETQKLPLPQMYGKNLIFKTGGVDGCDCDAILKLIEERKIDTTPLITHTFPLSEIEKAYDLFENRKDGVIKIAIRP